MYVTVAVCGYIYNCETLSTIPAFSCVNLLGQLHIATTPLHYNHTLVYNNVCV